MNPFPIAIALLAALAAPVHAQLPHEAIDDGLPNPASVYAGPVVKTCPQTYPMDELLLPAWPWPDGLSPLYITDVEIVGLVTDRSTRYGLENHTQYPAATPRVGRYVAGKLMYPPEFPWIWETEPLASYTPSTTAHGQTGTLSSFDGVSDGHLSFVSKPAGPSGYWGGGTSDGLPTTANLFVPYWNRTWWRGIPDEDGRPWVRLMLDVKSYWYFYTQDGDAPTPGGHWYSWEDRMGVTIEDPPEGVRYFYDRDGSGPIPEESVLVRFPDGDQPAHVTKEGPSVVRSREQLEAPGEDPLPFGSSIVELGGLPELSAPFGERTLALQVRARLFDVNDPRRAVGGDQAAGGFSHCLTWGSGTKGQVYGGCWEQTFSAPNGMATWVCGSYQGGVENCGFYADPPGPDFFQAWWPCRSGVEVRYDPTSSTARWSVCW